MAGLLHTQKTPERVGRILRPSAEKTQPTFVELMGDARERVDEYLIEFESMRGPQLRILCKTNRPPGLAGIAAPGEERDDDPDHAADASAGRGRAGRWSQTDRDLPPIDSFQFACRRFAVSWLAPDWGRSL